ncbi:MAG: isoleucine--tRNA ligase [Candidatus Sumerlaeota bacterium]|nr:isoleucine--tRNA ligase [Candidatus Sumerlaeota bacterium]
MAKDKQTGAEGGVDYRSTLNLPATNFPMKANLPVREPERLKRWQGTSLSDRILEKRRGAPKWVLHDGPPYANGDIHLGHALNKSLKDILVRYKSMKGFYVKYVPGFDCHGLPIEQKALESLGAKVKEKSPLEIRRLCHQFATKYIGLQSGQFQRLGVGGQWKTPYLTLDPKVEARALRLFRDIVAGGYVYKGFRPVYWDPIFQTALAEAEIEYEEHVSPSIYVRFPCLDPEKNEVLRPHAPINFVIWTTTPWTLPGNLAVCLHPDFTYVVAEVAGGERVVAAEELLQSFCTDAKLGEPKVLAKCKGRDLEGLHCSHPLLEKQSLVILGEHVTLEQGTGCVHTAPGHGAEDFDVCKKYGIEPFQPVDEAGRFTELYPPMQGVQVWEANQTIIGELTARGLLAHVGKITHQYPYSWRSHRPIIVRATEQWFLALEHKGLRQKCLEAIQNSVQWIPKWGEARIYNMVAARPDWCLSRQRAWGMPIPSLHSKGAGKSILALEVIDRFIEYVEKEGTDCWYRRPLEDFLPEGFQCPESGGTEFEKEYDILDVWFDSGATHASILEADPDLASPADLYLEGSDQHRGWFHSSLLASMAGRGRPPYRAVLTHGFLLDEKGEAMSKSKGNVISPLDLMKHMGADVLRLWVASEDYRGDIRASKEIFERVSEAYRRIRNTFRFLLGNLADFDETRAAADGELDEIDRWALARLDQLVERVGQAYEQYEFHRVYHLTHSFCVEMSAAYLDVIKDRLYCSAPADRTRRAAQTAMREMLSALARLLAPIIPFTADEVWEAAYGGGESVHLADFPAPGGRAADEAFLQRWERFAALREIVARKLEEARREKKIGASLEAAVALRVKTPALYEVLALDADLLRQLFIVSSCKVERAPSAAGAETLEEQVEAEIRLADGAKCERCWNWTKEVGQNAEHPALCVRCADVVERLNR